MKYALYALFCFSVLALAACSSPAADITKHFQAMTTIAKANASDCDAMGKALSEYLAQNGENLGKSVDRTSSSTTEESKALYVSSFELSEATRRCQNDSMDAFRRSLAELTLKGVEMPAPKPANNAAPAAPAENAAPAAPAENAAPAAPAQNAAPAQT